MSGFSDKKIASAAGKSSKRGKGKLSTEMRKKFKAAIDSVDLIGDLKQMEPAERMRTVGMLAKYVIPSLASIEIELTEITVKQFLQMNEVERGEYLKSLEN